MFSVQQFIIFCLIFFLEVCIGGVTGRGIILSQLHSWTQEDKGGTYQSQETLKRYGDLKRSMEEEGQVLGIGGIHM